MRNLLIGGSGFIGSALGQELIGQGEEVISLSRDGAPLPGVRTVKADLYEETLPQECLKGIDNVFILIGQIGPGFDAKREEKVIEQLATILGNSSAHVFYFSTSKVYGETDQPATEESPLNPIEEYAKFKQAAERTLEKAIPAHRLTIFRLSNIYGSPKNRGFIGLVIGKLRQDPTAVITLNGDGQQRRDYLFVDDLVKAVLCVRNCQEPTGIINIATGESHSLVEVVEAISEAMNIKTGYSLSGFTPDEPHSVQLSNNKLKSACGFDTFTPLNKGLRLTLNRYEKN